ncbi:MAG: substrate-binding domain-containing protein [Sciscionella sp.]
MANPAMRRHGLAARIRVLAGDYTEESGARAAAALLREGSLPTAIVAGTDDCALGVLDSLLRARVDVPGRVSVAGYDDSRVARLPFVNLTSARQDACEMAECVVRTIVERLDYGRVTPTNTVLRPEIVVRATTAEPRS